MTSGLRRLGARSDAQHIASYRDSAVGIVADATREAAAIRAIAEAEAKAEFAAWIVAARAEYAKTLAAEESTVVALACEVARAVLGREAATGDEVLRDLTRRAAERVRRARLVALRVHPADVDRAERHGLTWLPEGMARVELQVVADDGVERGGVIVESELGRIDARLDVMCAEVARILDGKRRVV